MLPELRTSVPGPESRRLAEELRRYESRNVTFLAEDFPVFWERGLGVNIWDVDGNRYLDLTSAFAVSGLGHNAPAVVEALREQSGRLLHAMGDVHPTREKVELCRVLSEITFERWNAGPARTILGNSGSDAVEAALKTAFLHTGRTGVISFEGGYHGLGYGSLETAGIPFFKQPFRGQLGKFSRQAPYPETAVALEQSRAALIEAFRSETVGAVLVEPVQGRGGEIAPPPDFLPLLRELCDAHGAVLIFDEIYTGFHRTGRLFACEHSGVVPDLICLGKALTSGFPLSACVGRQAVMDAWPPSRGEALHTSTFLGNPVGCAMALAAIREHLHAGTPRRVAQAAAELEAALSGIRSERVGKLRGIGLMRGLEILTADGKPDAAAAGSIITRALREGLLLLAGSPQGNVISITPPFEITGEEIAFAAQKIQEYVTSLPGSIS